MKLSSFDGTLVRVTTTDGDVFEGECTWNSAEWGEIEYGRREELLDIDHWLFFADDIKTVERIAPKETYIWKNRTEHCMRLNPAPYRMIEKGEKNIELRLYDEKRQKISPGDVIRFENTEDGTEVLHVVVQELYRFESFAELYRSLPLTACGYTAENAAAAKAEDMEQYYSPEEQKRFGVVGIRVQLI